MIKEDKLQFELERAGQVHGHICPSLFYGVSLSLKIQEWLKKHPDQVEEIILEGKSKCIKDGVFSVFGGETSVSIQNTGGCALTAVCSSKKILKIGILPSIRFYINELERALPLLEYRAKGVAYLKSLPDDNLFEEFFFKQEP